MVNYPRPAAESAVPGIPAHALALDPAQPSLAVARVSVVDIAASFDDGRLAVAEKLVDSFRQTGFAVVTGHGVPPELFRVMTEVSSRFFELPLPEKMKVGFPAPEIVRGYEPLPAPGEMARDLNQMESLLINRIDRVGDYPPGSAQDRLWRWPNLWPADPADLRAVWEKYYGVMTDLGEHLLELLAAAFELPSNWFADKMERHFSNLAANHYPPRDEPDDTGALRNRPHTDHGALTLLYRPSEPGGLEVYADQRWWQVPYVPGSLVLNVGDILERWTGGRLPATPHRVVIPSADAARVGRMSIVYFQQPDPACLIEPAPSLAMSSTAYRPVRSGLHISRKELGQATLDSVLGLPS